MPESGIKEVSRAVDMRALCHNWATLFAEGKVDRSEDTLDEEICRTVLS